MVDETRQTCQTCHTHKSRKSLVIRSKKAQLPVRKQPSRKVKKLTSQPDAPIKRALLIGINYEGAPDALKGCINDTTNLSEFLISHGFYQKQEIVMMNDNKKETDLYPTKKNIWSQLSLLLQLAQDHPLKEIQLLLAYSGHGASVRDLNRDETDGLDEALCPIDCDQNGYIVDDELNANFISLLPSNVKIVLLSDSCHSGTLFDLRYNYKCNYKKSCLIHDKYMDSQAQCVLIGGCRDQQTSADDNFSNIPNKNDFQGAMTASFLANYENKISYSKLISAMQSWISKKKYSQVVQLSSGQPIDVDDPFLLSTFGNCVTKEW